MIIRPAKAADIDDMVELLHTHMNSKFSRERWRRLFTYPWCPERPDYGRVAIHEGEIVGCIAAIYSDRWINGKRERIVNPAAWYLRKDARRLKSSLGTGIGLSLISDLTSNPECHYHINTSSKNTLALLRRIGFTVLDDAKYVWRAGGSRASNVEPVNIIVDPAQVMAAVSDDERSILTDHDGLPVTPVLIEADGQASLIIMAESIKGAAADRWFDTLYVSDPTVLGRHDRAIADALLTAPDMILAADCRFCSITPDGADRVLLEVARYVKSKTLTGHHIDHLYSEIQLLDQKLR